MFINHKGYHKHFLLSHQEIMSSMAGKMKEQCLLFAAKWITIS